ncbi:hypothetical protein JCM11251_006359 [Rhodosporidiobolus azoricus]
MAQRGLLCQYFLCCASLCLALITINDCRPLLFLPSDSSIVPLCFDLCAVTFLALQLIVEPGGVEQNIRVARLAYLGFVLAGLMIFIRLLTFFWLDTDKQCTVITIVSAAFIFVAVTIELCRGYRATATRLEEISAAVEGEALSAAEEGTSQQDAVSFGGIDGRVAEPEAIAPTWDDAGPKKSTSVPHVYSAVPGNFK